MRNLSRTAIDDTMWDIKQKLMRKCTTDNADRYLYPLAYYIDTGRAPAGFLKLLINLSDRQKAIVGNRLMKNYGNNERVINSVCQYIGWNREDE